MKTPISPFGPMEDLSVASDLSLLSRSKSRTVRWLFVLSLVLACLLLGQTAGNAATQYWDISATSGITTGAGNWSTSGSDLFWATSSSPGTAAPTFWTDGNDAAFQASTSGNVTSAVTLNGTVNANSITTINSTTTAASETISSGTTPLLIIGAGGITNTGNGTLTINAPIRLGASQTWNAGSVGGSIVVGGVISDNGGGLGITKTGTNTLTLNGSAVNTYTGPTIVNGGTLTVDMINLATPTNLINSASALTLGGATLIARGKTAAVASQTLGNLTLSANGGQNTISMIQVGTSTNLTLGNTWTRGAGSTLNISLPTGTSVTSNVGLANGIIGGYATYVSGTAASFATISGGVVAAGSSSGLSTSTNDGSINYSSSSTVAHNAGDWAANTVLLNGASLDIGGGTLTLTSGGLLTRGTASGADTITNGQLGATGSEVIIHALATATRTLEVSANISGGAGSLTKSGSRTLILTANNTYTGNTVIGAGTLQIGNAGTVGGIANSASVIIGTGTSLATGAVLSYNRTDSSSVHNVTGGGNVSVNSGTLTMLQSGSGLSLGQISGASGATLVFGGDGTGVTSVGNQSSTGLNYMVTPGMLFKVASGTVNLVDSARGFSSNIEVSGGTLNFVNNNLSMSGINGGTQTFTFSGGQINVPASFGVSGLNGNGASGAAGTDNSTFTATQSGGTMNVTAASGRFSLGSTSINNSSTYTLSAGTINHAAGSTGAFALGADTGGTSTTTFNMSGGKLIESVSISGSQGAGAKQAFVWTGGTLATFAYTATNLTSTAGTAVNLGVTNTLANGGGTLAPGDIGIVGKTLITGRYNVTSANAILAIDIGGTAASALFQETAGSGKFDNIQTNGTQGTASLDGKLNVALVDSFTPSNANTFKIVNTIASGLSGTFNNTAAGSTTAGGGVRVALADGLSSFKVTYNTADVTLGSYLASNEWSAATGSNWSTANDWAAFTPSLAGHIAKFADTPSAGAVAVNLDSNQTVAGLQFNSTTRNYTIGSGNASGLTLDNNGSASAITVTGSQSLNVPVTLNNNLSVTTTGSGDSLSIGAAIGGSGKALTKTGSGTLSLSGSNTYSGTTTVSAGTLLVSAGDINSSAVTVEAGAKLAYNSGTARTNTITLNGNGMLSRATLSGTGTISTALVLDNIGDTLSPGNSPGIQNFGTSQSWNAFTYVWELNSFTGSTAGTAFDQITITGGLTLTGASGAYLLDITSLLANNTPGNVPNFSEVNRSWTILTTTTGITGFNAANWTMGTTAFSSSPTASGTWALTQSGNDLVLGYAVPEPATWALLAFSLTTVIVLRRRRNS